ncbi:MAG: M23 family metallopeptidase [Deltaproteobacteria bacterium]|nr:M23 family metallopeptidase [Deltaproteobacteria bacterium]
MWRASLVLVALTTLASAEPASRDVATQLADELAVITKTLETVTAKLADADAVRIKRLRAAYRVLRSPLRSTASVDDRMAAARRRAGARLLVDRDANERGLLADEASQLRAARERTVVATSKLPTITLPTEIAAPARGTISRRFGTLEHERSKAMLTRRGIDIEVAAKAPVSAPADGTVRYAGPIRGLDEGVIIEHGDYVTVIAKLGDVAIPVGTRVARGDRIGHAARHRVYLEVRVRVGAGGIPIDPEPLLAARTDDSR